MSWKNYTTLRLGTPLPYELPYGPLKRKAETPTFVQAPEIAPAPVQRGATKQKQRLEKVMGRLSKPAQEQKRLKPLSPPKYVAPRRATLPTVPGTGDPELLNLRPKMQDAIAKFFGEAARAKDTAVALESHAWSLREDTRLPYRKRCRALYEILKTDAETRDKLLSGELKAEEFVGVTLEQINLRPKVQEAMAKFFGDVAGAKDTAVALESHAWSLREAVQLPYRKRCRAIYELLRSSADTRSKLLSGELKVQEFVEHCDTFVTAEGRTELHKAQSESLAALNSATPSRLKSTEYLCPTCGSRETEFSLLTSHRTSAKCDIWGSKDVTERDSVRVFCVKCTAEWSATY